MYHGSKSQFDTLLPFRSYESIEVVYGTTDYEYALVRCGNFNKHKFCVREDYDENGVYTLCELYSGAFEDLFDRPGYIHILEDSYFKFNHGTEYISETPVPVKEVICIENILDSLKKSSVKLIQDEDSEDYWQHVSGGKDGYLARKQKYVNNLEEA